MNKLYGHLQRFCSSYVFVYLFTFLFMSVRRRWEDNIKMDLQEVRGGGGDWMELAQERDKWRALVNTVLNFRVR